MLSKCWKGLRIFTTLAWFIVTSNLKVRNHSMMTKMNSLTITDILLDQHGVIKFVDFGAAKVIARQGRTLAAEHDAARQGRQRSMTGTPMYMSPEVIRGTSLGRHGA